MHMSKRTDPRDVVAAALAGTFLAAFIVLFAWLLFLTWVDKGQLPRFTQTETFTHVTTSIVGLVGGIAAARMGKSTSAAGLQGTFGWVYVGAYFILGLAALATLLVQGAGGQAGSIPEAIKNLGTVSFGLALASIGSYMGSGN
jgi:hypothetical protein